MTEAIRQDFSSSIGSADGILAKLKKYHTQMTEREKTAAGEYYGMLSNTRKDVPLPYFLR